MQKAISEVNALKTNIKNLNADLEKMKNDNKIKNIEKNNKIKKLEK